MDIDDTASGSGAQKRRTVSDDDRIIGSKIPRTTERDSAEQRVFDRLFGPPPEEMQQEAIEPAPCRTALYAESAGPAKKMDTDETASGSGARNRRTVVLFEDRKIERRIPRITDRSSAEDRDCDWMIGFAPVEVEPGRWPLVPRTAAPVPAEAADSVNKMDTDGTASGSGAQKRRTVSDDDRIIGSNIPRTTERDSAEQRVFDRLFGPPPEEMQQEKIAPAPRRTALYAEAADPENKMDTDDTASGSGAQKRRAVPDDDRIIERKIPRTTERDSAEQRVFDRLFEPPPEEMQQEAIESAPSRTALSPVATSYYWQEASYGEVPARAVRAGSDKDGGPLYVGRAPHAGDLLPAKVAPTHQGAFVSWNCLEHSKFHYEVLVLGAGVAEWVPSSNGEVPDGAVPVGHTTDGETLYVARVQHDGTTTPGKVHQSHSVCYIPYGGREIAYSHYEVLVI